MNKLNTKAFFGLIFLTVILGAALFMPAWSFDYWQAWLYLILFFVSTLAITLYLVQKDPALLERRVQAGPVAEKEKQQKVIQSIAQFAFVAIYLVSAFDHRFAWTLVPTYAVIAGEIMVVAGMFIVFLVFKENTFTSATIEVGADQKVISTGPYALVRHPMYSGALLMLMGTPISLGSWLGLFAFMPMIFVISWRLTDEEKFLSLNLPGYQEYCKKVTSRIIPGII